MAVDLWAPLDLAKIPNAANVKPEFVNKYPDGPRGGDRRRDVVHHAGVQHERLSAGAGFLGFLWDPANADKLGLLALVSNSFLLEITAKTFFGGPEILDTEEGILR
jgi:putative spermidine/putrescine transport system substrate-binding protein